MGLALKLTPPCLPPSPAHCRIGVEHEKLGFNLGDNSRMDYAQIEAMLRKLESRFGWVPIIEAGR